MDDNPYRSPGSSEKGEWDHSLFWTVVRLVCKGFMILLFVDALLLAGYWGKMGAALQSPPKFSEVVKALVTGVTPDRSINVGPHESP